MENNYLDYKAIVKFLSVYKNDESLRGYFLRKFDDPDNLFWLDTETDYRVDFLFVDTDDDKRFWIENFNSYSYLYVYALLSNFREQFDNDTTLTKRHEMFLKEYSSEITDNIELFKRNRYIIPPVVLDSLGYIIDAYSWKHYTISPLFLQIMNGNELLDKNLYSKYYQIFVEKIERLNLKEPNNLINELLAFCKTADISFRQNDLFIALVRQLFNINNDDIDIKIFDKESSLNKSILELTDCPSTTLGLFLNYCKEQRQFYNISSEILMQIELRYRIALLKEDILSRFPYFMGKTERYPWNWPMVKSVVEEYVGALCSKNIDEFKYACEDVLSNDDLKNLRNKHSIAASRLLTEIGAEVVMDRLELKNIARAINQRQEEELKVIIRKRTRRRLKDDGIGEKSLNNIMESVYAQIYNSYVKQVSFINAFGKISEERDLLKKPLTKEVQKILLKYAENSMDAWINVKLIHTDTINSVIDEEDSKNIDDIVRKELHNVLADFLLSCIKKQIDYQNNKPVSDNDLECNTENPSKQTDDSSNCNNDGLKEYDNDPKKDPCTSWIYMP